jgi:hypothetical protein
MANSYTRPCRTCQRRISMRQMPHGKWVAFENDEPHNCNKPPQVEIVRSPPRKAVQVEAPAEFDDIVIPEQASPQTSPVAGPVEPRKTSLFPPASGPVQPRPSASLTSLRPHPATNINQSSPARRNLPRPAPVAPPPTEAPPHVTEGGSTGWLSGATMVFFTVYSIIGVLHSIAFSLFVSRMTCATTTKTLISIFCNTGMGISHLIIVLGWPWYWF